MLFRVLVKVWADLPHTGHAYSAVEKHNASVVILNTESQVPHLLGTRFLKTFFSHT